MYFTAWPLLMHKIPQPHGYPDISPQAKNPPPPTSPLETASISPQSSPPAPSAAAVESLPLSEGAAACRSMRRRFKKRGSWNQKRFSLSSSFADALIPKPRHYLHQDPRFIALAQTSCNGQRQKRLHFLLVDTFCQLACDWKEEHQAHSWDHRACGDTDSERSHSCNRDSDFIFLL